MEKLNSQLEHGHAAIAMEQTRGLFFMCDTGVARCQSQHQYHFCANEFDVQSIARASELGSCQ